MPKLAMAMKEGQVVEWIAAEGEPVKKGQVVVVIETEKVTYEIEAPASGLFHIMAELGQTVDVGETIALVAESADELKELQSTELVAVHALPPEEDVTDSTLGAVDADRQTPPGLLQNLTARAPVAALNKRGKVKISPLARKIAALSNMDTSRIKGTGPGGRIKKRDILQAQERGMISNVPADGEERINGKRVKRSIPFKGMRKAIADHMLQSLTTSAQLTTMCEIDVTEIIRMRARCLQEAESIGIRISYTDILTYILSRVVRQVPQVNASLVGDEIKIWEDINVGVAVALQKGDYETGLIVPVVKNADRKGLAEISAEIKTLSAKARKGKLLPDDLAGGTVTLSNVGTFIDGWTLTTPIINQPEAIIVQPGGISERAVVDEGEVVVRPVMTMSITFDHRLLDGVPVGNFLNLLKKYTENPGLLLL